MRIAWKYVPAVVGRSGRDRTPSDFTETAGPSPAFATREELLSAAASGTTGELLGVLRTVLARERTVLSLASGSAVHEAALAAEGYRVVASDFAPEQAARAAQLVPELVVRRIDALDPPRGERFDDLAHWIDYALDSEELDRLLAGAHALLAQSGRLLLTHTYRDTVATRLIDQVLLPLWARPRLAGKRPGEPRLIRKQHGYRRTERELVAAARGHGFELKRRFPFWYGHELLRLGVDMRAPRLYGFLCRTFRRLGVFPYGVLLELYLS